MAALGPRARSSRCPVFTSVASTDSHRSVRGAGSVRSGRSPCSVPATSLMASMDSRASYCSRATRLHGAPDGRTRERHRRADGDGCLSQELLRLWGGVGQRLERRGFWRHVPMRSTLTPGRMRSAGSSSTVLLVTACSPTGVRGYRQGCVLGRPGGGDRARSASGTSSLGWRWRISRARCRGRKGGGARYRDCLVVVPADSIIRTSSTSWPACIWRLGSRSALPRRAGETCLPSRTSLQPGVAAGSTRTSRGSCAAIRGSSGWRRAAGRRLPRRHKRKDSE